MLAYPINLEDDDGTLLATSPDFPELTTFGDDREEAIARAVDALEQAIAARIHVRHRTFPRRRGARHTPYCHTRSSGDPMARQGNVN